LLLVDPLPPSFSEDVRVLKEVDFFSDNEKLMNWLQEEQGREVVGPNATGESNLWKISYLEAAGLVRRVFVEDLYPNNVSEHNNIFHYVRRSDVKLFFFLNHKAITNW
jgi:hypothetical protein